MPVIAFFFDIVIRMYYKEHEPRHFHAEHQAQEGKFDFDGNQTVGNITSKTAPRPDSQVGAAEPRGPGRQLA